MISELVDNTTGLNKEHGGSAYHSNIKILDMSFNNISKIQAGYFRPAEISLTHLYLGNNLIKVFIINFSKFEKSLISLNFFKEYKQRSFWKYATFTMA